MTEATQTETRPSKRASVRKPRVQSSGRTPRVPQQSKAATVPQQSIISTEPSADVRLGDVIRLGEVTEPQVGGAYPEAVARQRAATARGRRASAARTSNGPVESSNVLDGLPLALRRLVLRTGDVRKIRQFSRPSGALGIEMDLATARSLKLLR